MLLNVTRAKQFMELGALDVLLTSSPANVQYLTGYACWLAPLFREYMIRPGASSDLLPSFALLTSEGRSSLVLDALFAINAAGLDVDHIYPAGHPISAQRSTTTELTHEETEIFELLLTEPMPPTPVEGVLHALQAQGLAEGRIGVDMEEMSQPTLQTIRQQLPNARISNCSNLLRLIRMVKSEQEIGRMRRATAIAERAARQACAIIKPGDPMQAITDAFRARIAHEGADFDHMLFGPRGLGLTSAPRGVLRGDEVFLIDYGCKYDGYFSDGGFTVAGGPVSAASIQRYEAVLDCVVEVGSAMTPGMKSSEVAHRMVTFLTRRGLSPEFPHGHGLGLELRDYPILVPDTGLRIRDDCIDLPSDLPLEQGMVLNLEVSLLLPSEASLEVEITFLLGADGGQPLVEQDRQEIVRCD